MAHYTLAGAVDDVSLPSLSAFDWNNSTAWNRGLWYISIREFDQLLRRRGSSGDASKVNLRMMSTYNGKAEVSIRIRCPSIAAQPLQVQ